MSEQNKIEQIKAYVELCEEEGYEFQHLDNIKFLLQEIERKDEALNEIELILTDDKSTQAIEINQTINRAREAL